MVDLSKYSDEVIMDFLGVNAEEELKKRGYDNGWHKKGGVVVGHICIFVGTEHPGLVRIGFATSIWERIKQMNGETDRKETYHCFASYGVTKAVTDDNACLLFSSLFPKSDGSMFGKEWLNLPKEKAYEVLYGVACMHGHEDRLRKNPLGDGYFNKAEASFDNTVIVGDRIGYSPVDGVNKKGVVLSTGRDSNGPTFNVRFDDGTMQVLNKGTFDDCYAWKLDKNDEKIGKPVAIPSYCCKKVSTINDRTFVKDNIVD